MHRVLYNHSPRKFALYSAHDYNLAGLLAAMEQFDGVNPPFASTLIFELHKKKGKPFVNILFNN